MARAKAINKESKIKIKIQLEKKIAAKPKKTFKIVRKALAVVSENERLKLIKKPIGIFDNFDYNAYYILNFMAFESEEFKEEIIIFEFKDMAEALSFYRENALKMSKWRQLSCPDFLKDFNFKVLQARNVVSLREAEKLQAKLEKDKKKCKAKK
jgi:hypothetical protein